jgi:type IV secretion system protein VirD4
MARALMTPDELRRMDNDNCIIFAKGLKPIMAKKFWYYKKPHIVKDFDKLKLSHNDYDIGNRGEWRKYNPYSTDDTELNKDDTEIASLDDLFSDDFSTTNDTKTNTNTEAGTFAGFEPDTTQPVEPTVSPMDSPLDDDELDIEKQLEAKFDQLFGTGND